MIAQPEAIRLLRPGQRPQPALVEGCGIMSHSLSTLLRGWTNEDLANLCHLLGIEATKDLRSIEDQVKWLYHSKTRAGAESAVRNISNTVLSKVFASRQSSETNREALREMPTYDELLIGACKHVKAFENGATSDDLEIFLSHAVILAALQRMEPRERQSFFEQQVNAASILGGARVHGSSLAGPTTTFALLGAAQASGFGIYVASTTALGFLTHAVGVTLPFAVYTGMTSTIAFLIGPVGWLSAGLWGAWQLTQPKWKKLIPALVYVIAINSKRDLPPALR